MKTMIAGIGNIFFGDDAFGCEVLKVLQTETFPSAVKLKDFGIGTRDLAFELCENYETVILIDAVKLEKRPGTVSLIQIEAADFDSSAGFFSHELKLAEILPIAKSLGARWQKMYLVGCEPESLEVLSETVKKSVVKAVEIVKNLIK